MRVNCFLCHIWGEMGSGINWWSDLKVFLCNRCSQNMKCDYCEHTGPLGEYIKFCSQCGKVFCPGCKWKLPTRMFNAFKEKVLHKQTGRQRPGFRH